MVIALLALGLVMILGGVAAVVTGFPHVRIESGLAMVIAGATVASAGAVTLGLAAIVLRLKRIEAALLATRFAGWDHGFGEPISETTSAGAPATDAAGQGGMAFGVLVADNAAGPVEPAMPTLEPADRIGAPAGPAEPWLPEPRSESSKLVPARLADPLDTAAEPSSDSAAAEGKAVDTFGHEAELTLRPSLDPDAPSETAPAKADIVEALPVAGPEPVSVAEAPPAAAEEAHAEDAKSDQQPGAELEVIGTYSSGGNTYVMFADGTIEAETPRGRFNFNSLEELKDFVDSGGEHETRGAA